MVHAELHTMRAVLCQLRAALQAPAVATGFLLLATKWLTVVRLLLGEIPERTDFQAPKLQAPLAPYLALTAAVRGGDVTAFNRVAEEHAGVFEADRVHHLVSRLRYNVLRSGLRRISLAYSRISLQARRRLLGARALGCHAWHARGLPALRRWH